LTNDLQPIQKHEQYQHRRDELGHKEQSLDQRFIFKHAAVGERLLVALEPPHPTYKNADEQTTHRHQDIGRLDVVEPRSEGRQSQDFRKFASELFESAAPAPNTAIPKAVMMVLIFLERFSFSLMNATVTSNRLT